MTWLGFGLGLGSLQNAGSGGESEPPFNPGTLNPLDKHADITLSNGDLTATKTIGGGWRHVRSQTSHDAGKYYYECVANVISAFTGAGFSAAAASLQSYAGSDANGMSLITDGSIFRSGGVAGNTAAIAANDTMCFAIDLDNNTFWARKNNDNWNNSGTADPETNTGGLALPAGMTAAAVFAAVSLQTAPGDQSTVNFGASAFTYVAPTGFSPWG